MDIERGYTVMYMSKSERPPLVTGETYVVEDIAKNKSVMTLKGVDKPIVNADFNIVSTVIIKDNNDRMGGVPSYMIDEYVKATGKDIPEYGIQEWMADEIIKLRDQVEMYEAEHYDRQIGGCDCQC